MHACENTAWPRWSARMPCTRARACSGCGRSRPRLRSRRRGEKWRSSSAACHPPPPPAPASPELSCQRLSCQNPLASLSSAARSPRLDLHRCSLHLHSHELPPRFPLASTSNAPPALPPPLPPLRSATLAQANQIRAFYLSALVTAPILIEMSKVVSALAQLPILLCD